MIEKIANLLEKATKECDIRVTVPEQSEHGHYSTNLAFQMAKMMEVAPNEAAKEIRDRVLNLAPKGFFERIDIENGFLNFTLSDKTLAEEISQALKLKEKYWFKKQPILNKKTIVVDYSAPNIAKPMNVGHLRSTIIGQAIINLLKSQGYKVIGDNHFGDWGTQFGSLLYAFKTWGERKEFEKDPITYLVNLYIRFHKESEGNEELLKIAREETNKLQKGDKENRKLWREFVRVSQLEFNKTYKRLGVKFDLALGESYYQPFLKQIVDEAIKKGITRNEEGAIKVAFNNEKLPDIVIQKSDGSHLYSTTDLATIQYRIKRYHPEKILYVVANEQALHFSQIFEVAKMLGITSADLIHIKFGMLLGGSGKKMSTRRGEFVRLEDLLDRAVEEAGKINKDSADIVGLASVKYFDLAHQRQSDIVFDWDKVLNLKGNSAPYLLYAYTRLKSVIKKAGFTRKIIDINLYQSVSEKALLRQMLYFKDAISYSAENYEPNYLCDYLYKLANNLNAFYEMNPVIGQSKGIMQARLGLAELGTSILKTGFKLLGIETTEKM